MELCDVLQACVLFYNLRVNFVLELHTIGNFVKKNYAASALSSLLPFVGWVTHVSCPFCQVSNLCAQSCCQVGNPCVLSFCQVGNPEPLCPAVLLSGG